MSNYTYTSFSTNAPQSPESHLYKASAPDYLSNNPLRASQVVPSSSQSARVVGLSLPELQTNFVLMSAEVDRLLILNSLMSKEAEQWRQKYLDIERLGPQKATQGYGETDKDREIKYWKDKNMQTENEYLQKIHNIKTQTEGILREQIEREVKSALKYMEEEKRIMQNQISDLQRERDQLARGAVQNDFQIRSSQDKDREVAYWKDKFQNLEASLEPRIRSAIETRLQETITPILREKDALAEQLEMTKRRANDQEREKRSSPSRDNVKVYIDQLKDYEDRINKLENEKRPLQLENDNLNRKVREYDSVIQELSSELERVRRSGTHNPQMEFEYNNLNRKSKEYENELEALRRNDAHRNEDINKLRMDLERVNGQKHELENRIQNYEKEKTEYQHSLDVLKQKFRDFEGKMGLLLEENERLKGDAAAKDREIHQLKTSQTYEREAHDLKRQLGVLEDRVRDDRNEYARRMQALEDQANREKNESARLAEILRSREGEVENWKQKYQNLEKDTQNYIQKLMNEAEGHFRNRIEQEKNEFGSQVSAEKSALERQLAMAEQQVHDHDREIAHLRDENSHLTAQSNKLTQELNSMRSRIETLTRESNAKVEEFRRKYEQDQKVYLESELRALHTQLNDKIILYEQEVNRLTNTIREHELKQVLFFIEIERLYLVNGEFIEEINRITEEINHLLADNEKLNQQIVSMRQNNQDRTKYEEIIHGFRDQIDDYEHRIQHLMAENARLSDTSVERLKEINSLKNSYSARVNQTETAKRSQPGDFKKSQADFNELNLRFENERNKMEAQMNQMRQALESGQRENVKLQEINAQRKSENEKLSRELEGLRSSSWTSQNLEAELRLQNEQYQQSLKEVEEMRKARDFYRQQYDQVSAKLKETFNERVRGSTSASQQNWQQGGPTPNQFASPKAPNDMMRFK